MANEINDSIDLAGLIETESYYGLNLRFVLAAASDEERTAIREVFQRAHYARLDAAERVAARKAKAKEVSL